MSCARILVGFIVPGVTGRAMAAHILKAGFPLVVHYRSHAKAGELAKERAQAATLVLSWR